MIPEAPAVSCYTLPEVLALLKMPRATFYTLHAAGALPFVHELRPRLGRHARFAAEPLDCYLRGDWQPAPMLVARRGRR